MLLEGVDTHLMVGWTRLRGPILRGEWRGVAVHRAPVHTDRCTGRGCMWNEHMGAPHHSTGPGSAILPVEGADTHLTVGGTRLRGPTLRRVAGVAVHRATRCTPIGVQVVAACGMRISVSPIILWGDPAQRRSITVLSPPSKANIYICKAIIPIVFVLPVFYHLNSCSTTTCSTTLIPVLPPPLSTLLSVLPVEHKP